MLPGLSGTLATYENLGMLSARDIVVGIKA
jgi:hypothetical protein